MKVQSAFMNDPQWYKDCGDFNQVQAGEVFFRVRIMTVSAILRGLIRKARLHRRGVSDHLAVCLFFIRPQDVMTVMTLR